MINDENYQHMVISEENVATGKMNIRGDCIKIKPQVAHFFSNKAIFRLCFVYFYKLIAFFIFFHFDTVYQMQLLKYKQIL